MTTPQTPDLEVQGSSLVLLVRHFVYLDILDKELYSILSLFTPCINGYRRHTAGGDPAVVYHPVQGGVAILLGLPHVKETGISSGHLSLWLVCAFTWYLQLNGMGWYLSWSLNVPWKLLSKTQNYRPRHFSTCELHNRSSSLANLIRYNSANSLHASLLSVDNCKQHEAFIWCLDTKA